MSSRATHPPCMFALSRVNTLLLTHQLRPSSICGHNKTAPSHHQILFCLGQSSAHRASHSKQRNMGKRKVQVDSDDELAAEVSEDYEEEKPKKKRTPASKNKFTEPFVDKLGWNVEPPSLIWRSFGDPEGSTKIAAFDLDSTLVTRKSNSAFARDSSDWKWWNKGAPKKLEELVEDGYKIVIFTNQGSIKGALDGKAKEKVEGMVELIYNDLQAKCDDVPLQCFMAPSMAEGDACRKPAKGMWEHMVAHCNDGEKPDLSECFFVGDADGSAGAHSNSDRLFAEAVGIAFKTPQDFFGPPDGKPTIDRDAIAAAAAGVESGDNPNADLIMQLKDLADQAQKASKDSGDAKLAFKARAYRTAADAISTFPEKVADDNIKAVNALKGVGKGTISRVKEYLKTGSVMTPDELEEQKAAGGSHRVQPSAAEKKEALAFL